MSYRRRGGQQYRVKYRYVGKTYYTSQFQTREDAERWAEKWKNLPRPAKYKADSLAQIVSDVEPVQNPTPGYSRQWKVRSETNPDTTYTVSLKPDGSWECSCPHWIYRHRECKHIRKVKNRPPAEAGYVIDEYGNKQLTLI